MAKNNCLVYPTIKVMTSDGVKEVKDPVYAAIYNKVKNRNDAIALWACTQTKEFKNNSKNLSIEEIINKIIRDFNLEKEVSDKETIAEKRDKYNLGTADNKESFPIDVAVKKMNEINSKEDKVMATVENENGNFVVELDNIKNVDPVKPKKIFFTNSVYNGYIDMLNSLGFTIDLSEDSSYEGVFDPTSTKTIDGLVAVIQITKGELGEEAFPEELAHFIIEGLVGKPLVDRLLSSISNDDVITILGDEYHTYKERYDNNMDKLKKEAAGKLLSTYIKNGASTAEVSNRKTLLARLWDFIKSLFSKVSNSKLYDISDKALKAAEEIYKSVEDRSFLRDFDSKFLNNTGSLFKLNINESNIKDLTNEMAIKVAKQSSLDKEFNIKNGILSLDQANKTKEIAADIDDLANKANTQTKCISKYLKFVRERIGVSDSKGSDKDGSLRARLEGLIKEFKDRSHGEFGSMKELRNINDLKKVSSFINSATDFIEGNIEIITLLSQLDSENKDMIETLTNDLGFEVNDTFINRLDRIADDSSDILKLMNSLASDLQSLRIEVLYSFVATTTGLTGLKIQSGVDKNNILTLDNLLTTAYKDASWLQRWLGSIGTSSDLILSSVYKAVETKKAERDEDIALDIAYANKLLENLGGSTDFMYQRDKDGKLTRFIINQYDWDGYKQYMSEQYKKAAEECTENGELNRVRYEQRIEDIKKGIKVNGEFKPLMVKIYYTDVSKMTDEEKELVPYESVPNPEVFSKNVNALNKLTPKQREYYDKIIELKKSLLFKTGRKNQGLFRAPSISKKTLGMLGSSSNPIKTGKNILKQKFTRTADDIGFGDQSNTAKVRDKIKEVISEKFEGSRKAKYKEWAKKIKEIINDNLMDDEYVDIDESVIVSILYKSKYSDDNKVDSILQNVLSQNFYSVSTSLNGSVIHRVPIHYANPVSKEDVDSLDTDFGRGINVLIASYHNYIKMEEISDVLELMNSYLESDREIVERNGDMKAFLTKVFRDSKTEVLESRVKYSKSASKGAFDHFLNSAVYDRSKEDSGGITIGGVRFDYGKIVDTLRGYTSEVMLNSNIFSALSNVLVGKLQQWIEAHAGQYFDTKDYAKANAEYTKLMVEYMSRSNSHQNDSKLGLLIEKFDALEDFYEQIARESHNSNALYRFFNNSSLGFFGLHAGEHMLHCTTMIAMLMNIKVHKKGDTKEVSLYDILTVKEEDYNGVKVKKLVLEDGYMYSKKALNKNTGEYKFDKDGNHVIEEVKVDNSFLISNKLKINQINKTMNGAFNNDDKGEITRYAAGRCLMQFRQWMVRHYERRYGSGYYDPILETWVEGYYRTFFEYFMKDLSLMKFVNVYSNIKDLPEWQQANIRRALSEIYILAVTGFGTLLVGNVKDKDYGRMTKMAIYQLNRMFLETSASVPLPSAVVNLWQMIQSPFATIKGVEKIMEVLKVWHIMDTVKSGSYKGDNVWVRDVMRATPYVGQIGKFYTFDNSMFRMFD